jgi:adenosylcobyric acid synthase
MANFTDFDALAMEPSVSLAFLDRPKDAMLADVLILPGTKQTLDDLDWVVERGFAASISAFTGTVIGICGGFQMLGQAIDDPSGVESGGHHRAMPGLGQLPVRTVLRGEKIVRRVSGRTRLWGSQPFTGYEIHMGETQYQDGAEPFAKILRENESNACADGAIGLGDRVMGTYIHGLFEDDQFRHGFVDGARQACGLSPAVERVCVAAQRQARINRWANHLRQALDLDLIRSWIEL